MSSSRRRQPSADSPATRICSMPNGTIGSASCRRASLPATILPPSSPPRVRNGFCGHRHRHWSSKQPNITFTARCLALHAATPRHATSASSIWRLWPFTSDNSISGRRIARRTSRTAPRWSALRSLASKAGSWMPSAFTKRRSDPRARTSFVHNEALANELAARFYAARGLQTIADAYLRNARYGYLRWGADGKVRQLDQLYPHLKPEEAQFPLAPSARRSNSSTSRP